MERQSPLLIAQDIWKNYGSIEVLKGVSLAVSKGEMVSIVGASGAGKSTLLYVVSTLEKADKGKVLFENQDLNALDSSSLAQFRNTRMGFVFQFHHLLPEFTAIENVCIPAWIGKRPSKEVNKKALELLDFMGLADKKDKKPHSLSGGEQQRVAVARALINNPSLVFADEPTGNLDSANATSLHELFIRLRNEYQQSFLIVTHNESLAQMSNRILQMKDGIIL
ncbi:MAG: ABC transporter ATP-binding protein [Chitinophagaceae bacterium]